MLHLVSALKIVLTLFGWLINVGCSDIGFTAALPLSGVVTGVDSSSSISIRSLFGLISSPPESTMEILHICNTIYVGIINLLIDLIWIELKSPDLDCYCLDSLYIAMVHHSLQNTYNSVVTC